MPQFNVRGIRGALAVLKASRSRLLTVVVAVFVVLVAGLTAPLWTATLPQVSLSQARSAIANEQTPAGGDKPALLDESPEKQAEGKAWLGIVVSDADGGAKVLQVVPESPAAKAGVKRDDVVTAVDNVKVASAREVVDQVQKKKPGDKVLLAIKRGDERTQVEVVAGTAGQAFARSSWFRPLPPELKGLEGVPLREMFAHFIGGTFKMKDENGQEVVVNITPGTVKGATSTSLTIDPNDESATREFGVSSDTLLIGIGPTAKIENLQVDSKVLVVTVGDSNHASIVVRASPAYNPLEDIIPNLRAPRVWPMPDRQQFWEWREPLRKPTPQPNM